MTRVFWWKIKHGHTNLKLADGFIKGFYVSKKQAFSFAAEILIRSYLVAGIVLESHTSCVSSSQIRVSFYMTLQSEMSLSSVMTVYIEVTVISTRQPDRNLFIVCEHIIYNTYKATNTLWLYRIQIRLTDNSVCNRIFNLRI